MWLTDEKGNFVEIEGFHPSNPYAYENKVVGKYDLAEEGVKLNNYNQQDVLEHINEIKVRIFLNDRRCSGCKYGGGIVRSINVGIFNSFFLKSQYDLRNCHK